MALGICLLIIAGLTSFNGMINIATAEKFSDALWMAAGSAFGVVVEVLSAFTLFHGG